MLLGNNKRTLFEHVSIFLMGINSWVGNLKLRY